MSGKSKFCPLPWIHSYIGNSGHYAICCITDEHNGYIRTNDTNEKIHISDGMSAHDIMNTDYLKKIRLKLLSGEFPEECRRCDFTEKLEGISRRKTELEQYAHLKDDLIKDTRDDGSITPTIRHADYRLGNTCNLQCRMCGPNATTKWLKDYDQLPDHLYNFSSRARMEEFKKIRWQNSDRLVQEFSEKSGKLDRLHFAGGEAFFIKGMEDILQSCIDSGESKNMILSYNTNLTILPPTLLEKWKSFKEIKLLVSIDAVGRLNEYIRYPSKWSDIDKNLLFIDKNHQEYNISEVIISSTVQMNNIFHLESLYQYLEKFNFIVPYPNLILLSQPKYMSLLALPKNLRTLAQLKIKGIQKSLNIPSDSPYHYLAENLQTIINHLRHSLPKDEQDELFAKFIEFSKIFDTKKDLGIFEANPEYKNMA